MEHGEYYHQALEFCGTLGSLAGVQVDAASKTFVFPLFLFMVWLENQVINNTGPKDTQETTDFGSLLEMPHIMQEREQSII